MILINLIANSFLFQLPNGVEFMRLLKSAKMKVRHPDDIQAVSLCPSAERDVYPMLHRVYPRKSTAAAPPKEVGLHYQCGQFGPLFHPCTCPVIGGT